MEITRILRRGIAGIAAVLSLQSVAQAGDLDNARAFWYQVNQQLGRDSTLNPLDTTSNKGGAIAQAVNSCSRDFAVRVGIAGHQGFVQADGAFYFTVNAKFIESGIKSMPLRVYGISGGGDFLYELKPKATAGEMSNVIEVATKPTMFELIGDRLFINRTADGDSLFVSGPVVALAMTDGADTTNIPDEDRAAVCDCATAVVGKPLSHPSVDFFWAKYVSYVRSRGGDVSGMEVGP